MPPATTSCSLEIVRKSCGKNLMLSYTNSRGKKDQAPTMLMLRIHYAKSIFSRFSYFFCKNAMIFLLHFYQEGLVPLANELLRREMAIILIRLFFWLFALIGLRHVQKGSC